jgi:hypothetical protein
VHVLQVLEELVLGGHLGAALGAYQGGW